jgi:hypothetical protein
VLGKDLLELAMCITHGVFGHRRRSLPVCRQPRPPATPPAARGPWVVYVLNTGQAGFVTWQLGDQKSRE